MPGRVGPAGMHRVDRDALAGQAAGPLAGERDLRALAAGVRLHAVVRGRARVERRRRRAARCTSRPRRRGSRATARSPRAAAAASRSAGTARAPGSRASISLPSLGHDVGVRQRAGVVDEHVEAVVRGGEALGERARASASTERSASSASISAPVSAASPRAGRLGALGIAADDADRRALPGEVAGRGQAEAGRRAGDDRDLARRAAGPRAAASGRAAGGSRSRCG